ncbi:PA2778 family cysteine peptidase [Desulfosediminicola ganghwensis]|uniref:PA2778 family cysteine peptidase n=1 Tax=Desulfosediminicola ganghwensis TaxID=2569540 RepID=UPI0010AB7BF7|nr:PA2778 family cysteine peptidase [Desulfosediminicola ganghwensis]
MLRHLCLMGIAGLIVFLAGCSHHPKLVTDFNQPQTIELTTTPFFPQEEYQCGPAALATLLVSSDVITLPDLLVDEVYIPGRQGSLQLEIIATTRRHGRIPYVIEPTLEAIADEIATGRTVLVLQNLGLKTLPAYHYAVVIGISDQDEFILRSGTTERLMISKKKFWRSWQRAESWGIVALKPGEMPADGNVEKYMSAVSQAEESGNMRLAEKSYIAFLQSQPDNRTALFGLANTMYGKEQYRAAARFYKQLLDQEPENPAVINNLAESLAAMQCYGQALELIDIFLCSGFERKHPHSRMTEHLRNTRAEISIKHESRKSKNCSEIISIEEM